MLLSDTRVLAFGVDEAQHVCNASADPPVLLRVFWAMNPWEVEIVKEEKLLPLTGGAGMFSRNGRPYRTMTGYRRSG